MDRNSVYAEIDRERDYQDDLNPFELEINEELILMREYIRRAEFAFNLTCANSPKTPTLHIIRKIAAMAVRCLEHHGCPQRKEGE